MSRHERQPGKVNRRAITRVMTQLVASLCLLLLPWSAAGAERPRISVAVGMGASFESSGLSPARTAAVPSFFAVGGFGQGLVGLDFGLLATTASGRFRAPDMPVDRLGIDAMLVIRPWAWKYPPDTPWFGQRLLRSLAAEVGVGYEHDSRGLQSGSRMGLRGGARVDVPLFPAEASQLCVRLAVRRLYGFFTPRLEPIDVKDTGLEAYAALVLSF